MERQDVEEANRLILTALQTSAVDPRTGRIDLDLVTTGISTWGRHVYDLKRGAIRRVISEFDKKSITWIELNRSFKSQSDQSISDTQFDSILKDLVDEGFIHMNGRTHSEMNIRKL